MCSCKLSTLWSCNFLFSFSYFTTPVFLLKKTKASPKNICRVVCQRVLFILGSLSAQLWQDPRDDDRDSMKGKRQSMKYCFGPHDGKLEPPSASRKKKDKNIYYQKMMKIGFKSLIRGGPLFSFLRSCHFVNYHLGRMIF
uniref:Fyve finger-containing phosphoinositide kinase n=1 Tax=Rhizophora mucronata TaxID=61149 RepID=A0A2P2M4X3_RHIMU